MIKAIILDFDGTIIDTETAWYIAFRDAYKEYDVNLTLETYSQCLGTSLQTFNPYTYLNTHYNQSIDLDQFRKSVKERHEQLMEKETIRPGILPLLKEAKSNGLKIGIASSSERAWIDSYLQLLGIKSYFDYYCTADTVQKVKPDPELYLQALEKMNIRPEEAIAIEDSPNGARAAVAANIPTVVIKNKISTLLPFGEGHVTIDSLANYDLQHLMKLANESVTSY